MGVKQASERTAANHLKMYTETQPGMRKERLPSQDVHGMCQGRQWETADITRCAQCSSWHLVTKCTQCSRCTQCVADTVSITSLKPKKHQSVAQKRKGKRPLSSISHSHLTQDAWLKILRSQYDKYFQNMIALSSVPFQSCCWLSHTISMYSRQFQHASQTLGSIGMISVTLIDAVFITRETLSNSFAGSSICSSNIISDYQVSCIADLQLSSVSWQYQTWCLIIQALWESSNYAEISMIWRPP